MCTVSWTAREDCYRLYFNRDESRSRLRANPPQTRSKEGVSILAPTDTQGGGSWIAVNDQGICAFLLNNYGATRPDTGDRAFRSRGEIPLLCASRTEVVEAASAVRKLDLEAFRPFILGVVGPGVDGRLLNWNGERLESRDSGHRFVTTSSFNTSEVESYRTRRFMDLLESGADLWNSNQQFEYHSDRSHADRAFNPLMSREDAETHCVSVVSVSVDSVDFDYYERDSATGGLASPISSSLVLRKSAP